MLSSVIYNGSPYAVLRESNDFGLKAYDLVGLPRRVVPQSDLQSVTLFASSVDAKRAKLTLSLGALLTALPDGENWMGMSLRTLARLHAAFLISEDPHHRLDVQKAAILMHQVSLVHHILADSRLDRVLIADEVGLGKTIEAGLIVKRVLATGARSRILYLAPARLVPNVAKEFLDKLDLDARLWIAGSRSDARLESDAVVIASINKAIHPSNFKKVVESGPWDVLVVDECHHLNDWEADGGGQNQSYKLVQQLIKKQPRESRLILMSGTPHQGNEIRFKNLIALLSREDSAERGSAGKIIYRTKDRVRDWKGNPLFPSRDIRIATVVSLGPPYEKWYEDIASIYDYPKRRDSASRASGWAKSQALQWAASSVEAGLGFLVRLGMRRLQWTLEETSLRDGLSKLRPYRGGTADEPIEALYARIRQQIEATKIEPQLDDAEVLEELEEKWQPDADLLRTVINDGIFLLESRAGHSKWLKVRELIDGAGEDKIVFFAQPVETVTVFAAYLRSIYGTQPAIIIGNQSDEERSAQVKNFIKPGGPRFLVSSRAGTEGLNMQAARRLIHLDIPWNPMELEQRIGRIHRFGSKRTVIVDTMVTEGTRECDIYRIAREKLQRIATQLAPEEFEKLFERVMCLLPPTELTAILGCEPIGRLNDAASLEIGNLVNEGYKRWSEFDSNYRQQEEQIESARSGEATWSDLVTFLTSHAGARRIEDVMSTSFEFKDDEMQVHETPLEALDWNGHHYACGDSGGLPIATAGGGHVGPLGLNSSEVVKELRASLWPDRPTGVAFFREQVDVSRLLGAKTPFAVLSLLRQTIRFESSKITEHALVCCSYLLRADEPATAIPGDKIASILRLSADLIRVKDPVTSGLVSLLEDNEQSLCDQLCEPTPDESEQGLRHVVWPLTLLAFV